MGEVSNTDLALVYVEGMDLYRNCLNSISLYITYAAIENVGATVLPCYRAYRKKNCSTSRQTIIHLTEKDWLGQSFSVSRL